MSQNTDPQGVKQVVEAVPDQNEESSRKRKFLPSLVSASVGPSTLTIRSLAAPRKTPVATSKSGTATNFQQLSPSLPGEMTQTASDAGRPLASGQPSPSGGGNLPAQATQALTAAKTSAPRRLPGSLAQPPAAGTAAAGAGGAANQQEEEDTRAAVKAVMAGLALGSDGEADVAFGILRVPLMRHQRMALAWMLKREDAEPAGGILADDQGLGKTVSTIALMVSSLPSRVARSQHMSAGPTGSRASLQPAVSGALTAKSGGASAALDLDPALSGATVEVTCTRPALLAPLLDDLVPGGTLVVCPIAVLHQWSRELADKVSPLAGLGAVHIYHGKGKLSLAASLARYGVVLTTFNTMALEAPPRPEEGSRAEAALQPTLPAPLLSHEGGDCDAAVLAEVEAAVRANASRARRREQSGGGPLFQVAWHRVVLDEAQSIKNPRTLVSHAASCLHASRRWCLTGTPIQNSVDDLFSYFRFLRYEPYTRSGAFRKLITEPLTLQPELGYKRLRAVLQAVLLRRTKKTQLGGQPVVQLPPRDQHLMLAKFSREERTFYERLHKEAKAEIKALKTAGNMAANYVNMLWMLLRLRQACNHPQLVRGATACDWAAAAPATEAEIAAVAKLTDGERQVLLATVEASSSLCALCGDMPEDPVVSTCNHVYCRQCINLQLDEGVSAVGEQEMPFECPVCNVPLGHNDILSPSALAGTLEGAGAAKADGVSKPMERTTSTKVTQLISVIKKIRAKSIKESQEALTRSVLSARSKSDRRMASSLSALPPPPFNPSHAPVGAPEKVLVFSQWTGMLDLVEPALRKEGLQFRRLDGTMNVAARERAIAEFKENPAVAVLIMSLKAAALGLNLVAANHVVLMDLWWNPTVEEQAIDRAHRIGQTRPVHVTRIIIKGTIEDKILQLQEQKRGVVDAALGQGGERQTENNKLTAEDLTFLFS